MNFYSDNQSIIACSTGTSANTAIAVIRLSGFQNLQDLNSFFSFDLKKTKPRYSHLSNLHFEGQVYDNVLLVYFPEGQSYTGENVLELSVHGNQLNVTRIINLFIEKAGFRHAHPGEFTYRALKNKKLSLSQIEGLDMLLNANSSLMLTQGLDILQGDLHAQYLALYDAFLKLKAAVEISIDFSDDVGPEEIQKLFNKNFENFFELISALKERTSGNISSLLAPEIALVGQTNAGKSSLFNILVNHERSIVSNIAGTTRDYVSEVVHINGTNYKLVDTAGIRESKDVVENIGIERGLEILKRAFFRLLIVNPFETNQEYLDKFYDTEFDALIFSHNDVENFDLAMKKIDISAVKVEKIFSASFKNNGDVKSLGPIEPVNSKTGPIEPVNSKIGPIEPAKSKTGPIEPVNSKNGPIGPKSLKSGSIGPEKGPKNLDNILKSLVDEKYQLLTKNQPILLDRHRTTIAKIYEKSLDFSNNIKYLDDVAIISSEVNILGNHLVELIGIVSPDDVLNSIFSNFCIGK